MQPKRKRERLRLQAETVRQLSALELEEVRGGRAASELKPSLKTPVIGGGPGLCC